MKSVIGFSHCIYEQYLCNVQFVSFQSDQNSTLDNPHFFLNNFAAGACSENLRVLMLYCVNRMPDLKIEVGFEPNKKTA